MTKACDAVTKAIMRQIDAQEIMPGRRLYESDIAQQLGMSRTPVRQAMDQMVADGIFERAAGKRGVVFPPLTRNDWESVVTYREVLETAIARLVAGNITEAGLSELEQSYKKMLLFHEGAYEGNETEGEETYGYVNSSFHITLASLCGNAYLLQSLKKIFWRSRLYDFYLGSFRRRVKDKLVYDYDMLNLSNEGHRRIIDAIRKKNADLAAEMVRRHLQESVASDSNGFGF